MRFLRILFVSYAILCFSVFVLLMLPVVLVSFMMGKKRGGHFIMYMAKQWACVWLFLIGVRYRLIVEQPLHPHRSYIFISNHNSYMDIPQILKSIPVHFRALGKAEAGSIPVFGWIYNAVVVTVLRSDAENRAKSLNHLRSLLSDEISIYIAPEGTFNMTDKPLISFFDGAFKLAIETQTPLKPMLFLDAADRLHWSTLFSLTPGPLRTVYLEEISPEGYRLDQVEELKSKAFRLMEQKLIEYKAGWIKDA